MINILLYSYKADDENVIFVGKKCELARPDCLLISIEILIFFKHVISIVICAGRPRQEILLLHIINLLVQCIIFPTQ